MIRTVLAMLLVFVGTSTLAAQAEPVRRDSIQPKRESLDVHIDGAGSTTINPLVSAWIGEYRSLHPGIQISYTSIGSAGGVRQIIGHTVSFAATDVPMNDEQLAEAGGRILQLPVALTAVVPIYNLAQVPELRLSGATLADILLGKITKWNDPAIADDNPGVNLPGADIKIFPTFATGGTDVRVMADYLSKVSPAFKAAPTNALGWPEFRSAYYHFGGGSGTAGFVATTPGAFGFGWKNPFSENTHAAAVKNSAGEFVTASPESIAAAGVSASSTQSQTPDFRISVTNAPGKNSYPIASFMWLLLPGSNGKTENVAVTDFVKWILTDGQKVALKVGYTALPEGIVKAELSRLNE